MSYFDYFRTTLLYICKPILGIRNNNKIGKNFINGLGQKPLIIIN